LANLKIKSGLGTSARVADPGNSVACGNLIANGTKQLLVMPVEA
jgi:hypothetical protein